MRAPARSDRSGAARRLAASGLLAALLIGGCTGDDSTAEDASRPAGGDAETTTSTAVLPASAQIGDEASTAIFDVPSRVADHIEGFPAEAYVPMELRIESITPMELDGVVIKGAWRIEGRMSGDVEDVYAHIEAAYAPTLPVYKNISGRDFLIPDHIVGYMAFGDGDNPTHLWISLIPLNASLPTDP